MVLLEVLPTVLVWVSFVGRSVLRNSKINSLILPGGLFVLAATEEQRSLSLSLLLLLFHRRSHDEK
jgi:hypothetical protein